MRRLYFLGWHVVLGFTVAGKASCSDTQIRDRLSKGFRDLEIVTFRDDFERGFDERLRVLQEFKDVVKYVSIHAPSDLTVAHVGDDAHREFAEHCVKELIRTAPLIDCGRVVFHGFYHVTEIKCRSLAVALREAAFQRCVDSIKRLGKMACDFGVEICLENINACVRLDRMYYLIFGASPSDLVETSVKACSDSFRLCFDAAHAHNFSKVISESQEMRTLYNAQPLSVSDFFRIISDNVSIIHLSDAKGNVAGLREAEHLPLGDGEVDFKALLEAMHESKFGGPVVLETQEEDMNSALNAAQARRYLEELAN